MSTPKRRVTDTELATRLARLAALNEEMQATLDAVAAKRGARPTIPEAQTLLDALCHAARLDLTDLQRAAALVTIELHLMDLKRRWTPPVQAIGRRLKDL